jgi:hypothetical protein
MSRRRSVLLTVALLAGTAGAVVAGVLCVVKRVPDFYAKTPCPDEWDTRDKAAKLVTRVQDLKNDIRSKSEWGDTFTAEDLNCFFAENMGRKSGLCALLPDKLHSPRVSIEGDRLRVGFRYGDGFWSTVVWIELRVWLVANETNLVAVEVCDLRAGGLPIGSQSVLDSIADAVRDSNVEVTWYRHNGNPVGLFRFYADQPRPSSQILTLEVKDGAITIAGRSLADHGSAGLVGFVTHFRGLAAE